MTLYFKGHLMRARRNPNNLIKAAAAVWLLAWTLAQNSWAAEPAARTPRKVTDEQGTTVTLDQPNPEHGIFEMKLISPKGKVTQWTQQFVDEQGRVIMILIRASFDENAKTYEGIQIAQHLTYLPNGNVATITEFFGDGRLKRRTDYKYSPAGEFLRGDITSGQGKKSTTSTPPEAFMYARKPSGVQRN